MVNRKKRSREEWARLVTEWRASGQSAQDFAKKRRVGVRTLHWWSSALRRKQPRGGGAAWVNFVEVPQLAVAGSPRRDGKLVLALRNGRRLSFSGDVEVERIAELVRALEGDEC